MSAAHCQACVAKERCSLYRIHRELPQACVLGERSVAAGQAVLTPGAPAAHLLAVKTGGLLLRRGVEAGAARSVAVLGQRILLGQEGLLQQVVQSEARAFIPSRICHLDIEAVRPQVGRHPVVGAEVALGAVRWSEGLLQWSAVARLPDALERVAAALRLLALAQERSVVDVPAREDMAELCGCAPETVSRAMAHWVRTGLVRKIQRQRVEWLG